MARKIFNLDDDQNSGSAPGPDRSLRCHAYDCPHNWSVSREGHDLLCSAHAWSEPNEWPAITQRLINNIAFSVAKRQAPAPQIGPFEKAEILKQLRQVMTQSSNENRDTKAWAKRLKARHDAGERLSAAQDFCYRSALNLMSKSELAA